MEQLTFLCDGLGDIEVDIPERRARKERRSRLLPKPLPRGDEETISAREARPNQLALTLPSNLGLASAGLLVILSRTLLNWLLWNRLVIHHPRLLQSRPFLPPVFAICLGNRICRCRTSWSTLPRAQWVLHPHPQSPFQSPISATRPTLPTTCVHLMGVEAIHQ